jgi:hypothetical protein
MTDASVGQPSAPLGAGSIISESFSILFGKFIQVVIITFVPLILGLLVSSALNGPEVAIGLAEPDFSAPGAGIGFALATIVNLVVYTLTTALLIQLAYDAKLGRPVQIGRYIGPALSVIVPLAILSIVATLLFAIGFALFVVPGLWIYAVFSVMAPAVVIERVGFGGLGRSASLTKGYRWPIVGTYFIAFIVVIIINVVAGLLVGLIATVGGVVVGIILFAALSTVGTGLIGIMASLIYARLREIKEGVSVDQIASVFE